MVIENFLETLTNVSVSQVFERAYKLSTSQDTHTQCLFKIDEFIWQSVFVHTCIIEAGKPDYCDLWPYFSKSNESNARLQTRIWTKTYTEKRI